MDKFDYVLNILGAVEPENDDIAEDELFIGDEPADLDDDFDEPNFIAEVGAFERVAENLGGGLELPEGMKGVSRATKTPLDLFRERLAIAVAEYGLEQDIQRDVLNRMNLIPDIGRKNPIAAIAATQYIGGKKNIDAIVRQFRRSELTKEDVVRYVRLLS